MDCVDDEPSSVSLWPVWPVVILTIGDAQKRALFVNLWNIGYDYRSRRIIDVYIANDQMVPAEA